MKPEEARLLSDQTNAFYQRVAPSFDSTRQHPWAGWLKLYDLLYPRGADSLRVLDLACGNLRFERFLCERVPNVGAWAYDACDELAFEGLARMEPRAQERIHYEHADLAQPQDLRRIAKAAPACDLCVSMAFMHHLPLMSQREQVLQALVKRTRRDGHIALSFWQFAKDQRIVSKAIPLKEPGDYLLGWQSQANVQRFCHSFSDEDIDELVATAASCAREVTRFWADGRRGDLNCYVVLQTV